MIETLRIQEIKIVEKAELEFGPGLNVLTGETGAGKSIILGALEMLAGSRGSADIPRKGSDLGTVEAVFRSWNNTRVTMLTPSIFSIAGVLSMPLTCR